MLDSLEVRFTPAEFVALAQRDLRETTCVVFDILRASTSMVTALASGALGILPVAEIPEALTARQRHPGALLAGERDGLRIRADLTGGVDFDLGNSPREFTREKVSGRLIIMSTTNGTRGLRACADARLVLAAAFSNLGATVRHLLREEPKHLLVVCSGTFEQAAYEDALAAGALCDELWPAATSGRIADSALMARALYRSAAPELPAALASSRNAQRLLSRPELADDVHFCLQRDTCELIVRLGKDGFLRAAG
jgi:2-phosphosulfolactate phosphatase